MKKYAVAALMLANSASAGEVLTDVGLGVFSTEGKSLSNVKFVKVGMQYDLYSPLVQRFNVGGWLDSRPYASNAAFGSYQLGLDVRNDVLEMGVFAGPGLISHTDSSLGGYFQFNETVFLGVKDPKDNAIGISYNHFSSAGLETPNQGKDFVSLEIKFPLIFGAR
jgi:hypothetical protein